MSADLAVPSPLPVSPSADPVKPLNQVERVVDSFVAPGKTFADILRSSSWWLPCLLLMVGALVTGLVVGRQVGFDRVYENQIHLSPKQEDAFNQKTPEQKAQQIAIGGKITRGITLAVPIVLLIGTAVYALILWGCFNFVLGAKTTFMQVMAVCFYASLPYLLVDLLAIAVLYLGGNVESYDYKNPVGTNLAYYLQDASPMLKALLGRLDVLQLWIVGLTAYGMHVISKKSVVQSAVVVGVLWLILTLITVGGAAMS